MVKLVSNRLKKTLAKVYSLSRKNKNETILIWIFLDSDRITNYKKFINFIPANKNIGVIFRSKKIEKDNSGQVGNWKGIKVETSKNQKIEK